MALTSVSNFHNPDPLGLTQKPEPECAQCECGSVYFVELEVIKIAINHQVILGQSAPRTGGTFKLYRCIMCDAVAEPVVLFANDRVRREYDLFLEDLEKKK